MARSLSNFKFFILNYTEADGFFAVTITEGLCPSLVFAKGYALYSLGLDSKDVPVIFDSHSTFHYYHPRHRVWYKNLTDKRLKKLFYWLIPTPV